MSEVVYEIKNLVKNYSIESQTLQILKGLNFTISKGSSVCIMGPSGSGKSTLLNLMGALDSPTSGKILYYGRDISEWTEDQRAFFRRDKLGFVFQSHYLLKEFTVLENISLPAYISKKSKKRFWRERSFYQKVWA